MKFKLSNRTSLLVAIIAIVAVIAIAFPATEAVSAGKKKVTNIIDPKDPTSVIYTDSSGNLAGVGDASKPVSEAWRAGQSWHPKALQSESLPKDKYGLVDWAKLVREGLIEPKHSLDENESEFPPLDLNINIKTRGDYVNNVTYPHQIHTYWLNCETCHSTRGGAIFEMAAGTNNMTMSGIARGEWCGRCHGKVAFPLTDCNKCHNAKKEK
ncbi:MAG: hypothetical protein KAR06_09935 [Deltaproteobacteria bacterium]|nr:hypothetical protein [Deltaproteobacteria bacterium]